MDEILTVLKLGVLSPSVLTISVAMVGGIEDGGVSFTIVSSCMEAELHRTKFNGDALSENKLS